MDWYAYVETSYDPAPDGWKSGVYTILTQCLNDAQLAAWGRGAISWSEERCRRTVEAAGGSWDEIHWRAADPRCTQDAPPGGTARHTPSYTTLNEIAGAAEGDDSVGLSVVVS